MSLKSSDFPFLEQVGSSGSTGQHPCFSPARAGTAAASPGPRGGQCLINSQVLWSPVLHQGRDIYCVHKGCVNVEATQISLHRGMDKQNVVFTRNGLLFSLKKEVLMHGSPWMTLWT